MHSACGPVIVSLICWVFFVVWLYGHQFDVLSYVTVSLICWALWSCDRQSDMLGFVVVWLSVWYVGLCGCMTVSLICWALWSCVRQSAVFGCVVVWLPVWYVGLCGHVTVSLLCWAVWLNDCQSDMLDFRLYTQLWKCVRGTFCSVCDMLNCSNLVTT